MSSAALVLCILFASCAPRAPDAPARATIDFTVSGVPIHDAFRQLGARAGVNFSVDPDIAGTATLELRAVPWRAVLDALLRAHDLKATPMGPVLRISRTATAVTAQRFTGTPIAVDFAGAPIRDVAAVLAAHAKLAIVVDDDVDASVTQRNRALPWDLVLDHITRKHGLRVVRAGDTIRITRQ